MLEQGFLCFGGSVVACSCGVTARVIHHLVVLFGDVRLGAWLVVWLGAWDWLDDFDALRFGLGAVGDVESLTLQGEQELLAWGQFEVHSSPVMR